MRPAQSANEFLGMERGPYDVIVVGAGAAGLMAAGQAGSMGARTLLLEKMDQPGRKIFITGKFRCNLTNSASIPEFIEHFGKTGPFLRQAFHRYFSSELIRFFEDHGVKTVEERGGRVFPASGRSQDVVKALLAWVKNSGVEILTHTPVDGLLIESGRVVGVRAGGKKYPARSVIIATGGASYPGTGSTGDGYRIAGDTGHTIVPIRPSLVPLVTRGKTALKLQGLNLRNVLVRVWISGEMIAEAFGEMLFTHFGVSGPVILTLSRPVVDACEAGSRVQIAIDLKPALDEVKLDARLRRDFDASGAKFFRNVLKGLLPSKLIPVCVEWTQIPGDKPCSQITAIERGRLLSWLKDFRLDVIDHRGFRHSIVTAGGISTSEIDPYTMESRLVSGLYFAGEIIDVDADTGGYNLQAAFSTGWLAGRSAAQIGDEYD